MVCSKRIIAVLSLIMTFAAFSVSYAAPLDAVYPRDGATDVPQGKLTLLWEGIEGYKYTAWAGDDAQSMKPLDMKDNTTPMADMSNLTVDTTYFWRVEASPISQTASPDIKSPVRRFTTSPLPVYQISPKYPADNAVDVPFGAVTLQWECEQPNVTFDLYFGSNADSLEKIVTDTSKSVYDVTAPEGRKYFWQVVIRDSQGNQTKSPVWSFTTKGDDSIGGGCTISSSPFSLLLGAPLILMNKISK